MNFYKHHIGDYAAATSHLSFVEDAAFSRLLRIYYRDERPLPVELRAVQRLAGARSDDEREAVETVLREFFVLTDEGWRNKRADEEVAKANAQADTNRRIAEEREARRRATKEPRPKHEACSNAHESSTSVDNEPSNEPLHDSLRVREPSQTPDSRLQTEAGKQKALARQAARFPEFWAAYPVKKGRAEALAKWTARNLDAIADRIIADVEARKLRDRQWLDGYAPHGSRYVNARGWEDEIEERRPHPQAAAAGHDVVFGGAE